MVGKSGREAGPDGSPPPSNRLSPSPQRSSENLGLAASSLPKPERSGKLRSRRPNQELLHSAAQRPTPTASRPDTKLILEQKHANFDILSSHEIVARVLTANKTGTLFTEDAPASDVSLHIQAQDWLRQQNAKVAHGLRRYDQDGLAASLQRHREMRYDIEFEIDLNKALGEDKGTPGHPVEIGQDLERRLGPSSLQSPYGAMEVTIARPVAGGFEAKVFGKGNPRQVLLLQGYNGFRAVSMLNGWQHCEAMMAAQEAPASRKADQAGSLSAFEAALAGLRTEHGLQKGGNRLFDCLLPRWERSNDASFNGNEANYTAAASFRTHDILFPRFLECLQALQAMYNCDPSAIFGASGAADLEARLHDLAGNEYDESRNELYASVLDKFFPRAGSNQEAPKTHETQPVIELLPANPQAPSEAHYYHYPPPTADELAKRSSAPDARASMTELSPQSQSVDHSADMAPADYYTDSSEARYIGSESHPLPARVNMPASANMGYDDRVSPSRVKAQAPAHDTYSSLVPALLQPSVDGLPGWKELSTHFSAGPLDDHANLEAARRVFERLQEEDPNARSVNLVVMGSGGARSAAFIATYLDARGLKVDQLLLIDPRYKDAQATPDLSVLQEKGIIGNGQAYASSMGGFAELRDGEIQAHAIIDTEPQRSPDPDPRAALTEVQGQLLLFRQTPGDGRPVPYLEFQQVNAERLLVHETQAKDHAAFALPRREDEARERVARNPPPIPDRRPAKRTARGAEVSLLTSFEATKRVEAQAPELGDPKTRPMEPIEPPGLPSAADARRTSKPESAFAHPAAELSSVQDTAGQNKQRPVGEALASLRQAPVQSSAEPPIQLAPAVVTEAAAPLDAASAAQTPYKPRVPARPKRWLEEQARKKAAALAAETVPQAAMAVTESASSDTGTRDRKAAGAQDAEKPVVLPTVPKRPDRSLKQIREAKAKLASQQQGVKEAETPPVSDQEGSAAKQQPVRVRPPRPTSPKPNLPKAEGSTTSLSGDSARKKGPPIRIGSREALRRRLTDPLPAPEDRQTPSVTQAEPLASAVAQEVAAPKALRPKVPPRPTRRANKKKDPVATPAQDASGLQTDAQTPERKPPLIPTRPARRQPKPQPDVD